MMLAFQRISEWLEGFFSGLILFHLFHILNSMIQNQRLQLIKRALQ